jgi:hypothetical protein
VVSAASEAEGKRSLEPRSSRSAWAKLETLRKKEKEGKRKEKRREGKRKEGRKEGGRKRERKERREERSFVCEVKRHRYLQFCLFASLCCSLEIFFFFCTGV